MPWFGRRKDKNWQQQTGEADSAWNFVPDLSEPLDLKQIYKVPALAVEPGLLVKLIRGYLDLHPATRSVSDAEVAAILEEMRPRIPHEATVEHVVKITGIFITAERLKETGDEAPGS